MSFAWFLLLGKGKAKKEPEWGHLSLQPQEDLFCSLKQLPPRMFLDPSSKFGPKVPNKILNWPCSSTTPNAQMVCPSIGFISSWPLIDLQFGLPDFQRSYIATWFPPCKVCIAHNSCASRNKTVLILHLQHRLIYLWQSQLSPQPRLVHLKGTVVHIGNQGRWRICRDQNYQIVPSTPYSTVSTTVPLNKLLQWMLISSSTVHGLLTWPQMHNSCPKLANILVHIHFRMVSATVSVAGHHPYSPALAGRRCFNLGFDCLPSTLAAIDGLPTPQTWAPALWWKEHQNHSEIHMHSFPTTQHHKLLFRAFQDSNAHSRMSSRVDISTDSKRGRSAAKRLHWKGFWDDRTAL